MVFCSKKSCCGGENGNRERAQHKCMPTGNAGKTYANRNDCRQAALCRNGEKSRLSGRSTRPIFGGPVDCSFEFHGM
jgi:hypothetical protein